MDASHLSQEVDAEENKAACCRDLYKKLTPQVRPRKCGSMTRRGLEKEVQDLMPDLTAAVTAS